MLYLQGGKHFPHLAGCCFLIGATECSLTRCIVSVLHCRFHIVHLEPGDVDSLWQSVHQSVMDVKEMAGSQYGRVNASNLALKVCVLRLLVWSLWTLQVSAAVCPFCALYAGCSRMSCACMCGAFHLVGNDLHVYVFHCPISDLATELVA